MKLNYMVPCGNRVPNIVKGLNVVLRKCFSMLTVIFFSPIIMHNPLVYNIYLCNKRLCSLLIWITSRCCSETHQRLLIQSCLFIFIKWDTRELAGKYRETEGEHIRGMSQARFKPRSPQAYPCGTTRTYKAYLRQSSHSDSLPTLFWKYVVFQIPNLNLSNKSGYQCSCPPLWD